MCRSIVLLYNIHIISLLYKESQFEMLVCWYNIRLQINDLSIEFQIVYIFIIPYSMNNYLSQKRNLIFSNFKFD